MLTIINYHYHCLVQFKVGDKVNTMYEGNQWLLNTCFDCSWLILQVIPEHQYFDRNFTNLQHQIHAVSTTWWILQENSPTGEGLYKRYHLRFIPWNIFLFFTYCSDYVPFYHYFLHNMELLITIFQVHIPSKVALMTVLPCMTLQWIYHKLDSNKASIYNIDESV